MEAVVLHRVRFLDYICPKQSQDFKPAAAPTYPNMGKVPPPPPGSRWLRSQGSLHAMSRTTEARGETKNEIPFGNIR